MQPIARDQDGILRFKANAIILDLFAAGPYDMDDLAKLPFTLEDREQFAQLTGYSVDGFLDLPYPRGTTRKAVELAASDARPRKRSFGSFIMGLILACRNFLSNSRDRGDSRSCEPPATTFRILGPG
jgi:hypothetical protein